MQQQIPLRELKQSPHNVRQVKASKEGHWQLVASIRAKGLLHNLVVVKNGKGYNVIDGGRRLEALRQIHKDKSTLINCVVLDSDDREVGLHANMIRENMHPLDECDVIMALVADGSEDFVSVAARFGQTDKWVKQRVGLAELSDKAKQMFRAYDFNIGVAEALTLGDHAAQDKYLEENVNYHIASIKHFMTLKKIEVKHALFDVKRRRDELQIESDLFSDEEYITNIDEFEVRQNLALLAMVEEYRAKGYADAILLRDSFYWDDPECRGFTAVYDEDHETYGIADKILCIQYNSSRFSVTIQELVMRETKEQQEAQEVEKEADEEVTPLTMSKPQEALLAGYYAHFMKNSIFENELGYVKIMKALLCHRSLGYTYNHTNRVGHVYADHQTLFPSEEYPDDYVHPLHEACIQSHIDAARDAFDADGTTPLKYCVDLPDLELDKLFVACCLTGLGKYDFYSDTIKEIIPDFASLSRASGKRGWFKPDAKWLNKYKINQIEMLEDYCFGKVSSGPKKARIEALVKFLDKNPVFDPLGDWPQYKPQ